MDEQQQFLLESIERAFRGVELGDGVSLHETHVLDNYGSMTDRLAARAPDEKHDWRNLIDDPDLVQFCGITYGGLCFFDATGLRFHLPACLSKVVKDHEGGIGNLVESLVCRLTDIDDSFAILDHRQRACVRDVLIFMKETFQWQVEALERAIAGYWSQTAP